MGYIERPSFQTASGLLVALSDLAANLLLVLTTLSCLYCGTEAFVEPEPGAKLVGDLFDGVSGRAVEGLGQVEAEVSVQSPGPRPASRANTAA